MRSTMIGIAVTAALTTPAVADDIQRSGSPIRDRVDLMPQSAPGQVAPTPEVIAPSRVPAIIATVATGALLVSTLAFYQHRESLAHLNTLDGGSCTGQCANDAIAAHEKNAVEIDRYHTYMLAGAAATVIAGGVTAYLWSRATERPAPNVAVDTDGRGARVLVGGRF